MKYSKEFVTLAKEFQESLKGLQKQNKSQEFVQELEDYIDIVKNLHYDELKQVLNETKVLNEFVLWKKQYQDKLNRLDMFQIDSEKNQIVVIFNNNTKNFKLINVYTYLKSICDENSWKFFILLAFFNQSDVFETFQIAEAVKI